MNLFLSLAAALSLDSVQAFSVHHMNVRAKPLGSVSMNSVDYKMEDIMDCATDGLCTVEDMEAMINEIEEINSNCSVEALSMEECEENAQQTREILKRALKMRVELDGLGKQIEECRGTMGAEEVVQYLGSEEDHSFNHYVDYRSIAQYESH